MKIAVKEVGKALQIVEVKEKYRDKCVRTYTGEKERAEYVRLNQEGTLCLAVNEAGLPLEMPLNFLLSTTSPYFPIQKMVGTVVFVRHKYVNVWEEEIWDYEVEDLTDEDLKLIQILLDDDYQSKLAGKFADYGKGFPVFTQIK